VTVLAVDEAVSRIGAVAGKGSVGRAERLVAELFGAATEAEQYFLVRLLAGELRQGALTGWMTDAWPGPPRCLPRGASGGHAQRVAGGDGAGRA